MTARRALAWISFDPVTSAYVAIIPALLFPVYFQGLAKDEGGIMAWGVLAACGTMVAGFSALLAASLSRIIPPFWLLCGFVTMLIGSTFVLSAPAEGSRWLPVLGLLAAQASYSAAMAMYESFLPSVATDGNIQRISGTGWAVGFSGGIAGIGLLIFAYDSSQDGREIYQRSFELIGILTAVLAIPILLMMYRIGFSTLGVAVSTAGRPSVISTLRDFRAHQKTFALMVSMSLIYGATSVVIVFTAPILADRFGASYIELLHFQLLLQVLSLPSTYIFGELSQRWSKGGAFVLTACGWGLVLLILAYGSSAWTIWAIVPILGCCVGATNAIMRGLVAETMSAKHAVVLFGLFTFAGRAASVVGPLVFVAVAAFAGQTIAFNVALAMLIVGATSLLLQIRPPT